MFSPAEKKFHFLYILFCSTSQMMSCSKSVFDLAAACLTRCSVERWRPLPPNPLTPAYWTAPGDGAIITLTVSSIICALKMFRWLYRQYWALVLYLSNTPWQRKAKPILCGHKIPRCEQPDLHMGRTGKHPGTVGLTVLGKEIIFH